MTLNRRTFLEVSAAAAAATMLPKVAVADEAHMSIALAARSNNTLDPVRTTQGADDWATMQIFDFLVQPDPGTFAMRPEDFRPALAESYESTPDAKTWIFKIRRGAVWHNNYGEVTPGDVKFTFDRARDPKIPNAQKPLYDNIANISIEGSQVIFTLKRPDPLFCGSAVYLNSSSIVPRKAVEERGDAFGKNPIGSGAYEFVGIDPTRGVMLRGHATYWGGAPKIATLDVRYILDTTARTLALASGQVDMIEAVRAPGWIQSMRQRKTDLIFDSTNPGSTNSLHINLTRKPFDNVLVRRALYHAIDREALAKALAPMANVMYGLNPAIYTGAMTPKNTPPDLLYPYDPERAKKLLAEAGFPTGFTFQAFTSQREDYSSQMLIVQEQLRKVGMNMELSIIDHTTYHANNRKDQNSVAMHASSYPPVPERIFLDQLSAGACVKPDGTGGTNYSHYGVAMPGVDDLITKTLDEPDFDKRLALVTEMEKQVLRDLPLIGLSTLSYVIARNPRINLGYEVKSGYARWPLRFATIAA
jgi:peptide/nickel transport system substrate-binding protein